MAIFSIIIPSKGIWLSPKSNGTICSQLHGAMLMALKNMYLSTSVYFEAPRVTFHKHSNVKRFRLFSSLQENWNSIGRHGLPCRQMIEAPELNTCSTMISCRSDDVISFAYSIRTFWNETVTSYTLCCKEKEVQEPDDTRLQNIGQRHHSHVTGKPQTLRECYYYHHHSGPMNLNWPSSQISPNFLLNQDQEIQALFTLMILKFWKTPIQWSSAKPINL